MTRRLLILTVLVAASSPPLSAEQEVPRAQPAMVSPRVSNSPMTAVSVEKVRFEAAAGVDAEPAAKLKFDLSNTSQQRLTDIVVEISVTEGPWTEPALATMVVRPFRIQGDLILEPGYSVGFEVLLRRLSADCDCAANVRVVSVRFLLDDVAATSH